MPNKNDRSTPLGVTGNEPLLMLSQSDFRIVGLSDVVSAIRTPQHVCEKGQSVRPSRCDFDKLSLSSG